MSKDLDFGTERHGKLHGTSSVTNQAAAAPQPVPSSSQTDTPRSVPPAKIAATPTKVNQSKLIYEYH
jgi:hypothetical protein